jgi:hypothetical protein
MTIVFTAVLPTDVIVMTVDSAVMLYFGNHREYEKGRKAYCFPGVGCVTTWGARDHNCIGEFLDRQEISHETHSVTDLADRVEQYLKKEYRPHELNLDDVGYHVAGFHKDGHASLYHVFWGFDRPRPRDQTSPKYDRYDHTPPPGQVAFLYNGRNDLAEVVVRTLLHQIATGTDTRFEIRTPIGLACFADFVARFAAELTPEVAAPFFTHLISQGNQVKRIKNNTFCPISRDEVLRALKDLGYNV